MNSPLLRSRSGSTCVFVWVLSLAAAEKAANTEFNSRHTPALCARNIAASHSQNVDEVGNASFYGTTVEMYWHKPEYTKKRNSCETGRARERGDPGGIEMKVIPPGKIVPYLPSLNISMKTDFDTDSLFN